MNSPWVSSHRTKEDLHVKGKQSALGQKEQPPPVRGPPAVHQAATAGWGVHLGVKLKSHQLCAPLFVLLLSLEPMPRHVFQLSRTKNGWSWPRVSLEQIATPDRHTNLLSTRASGKILSAPQFCSCCARNRRLCLFFRKPLVTNTNPAPAHALPGPPPHSEKQQLRKRAGKAAFPYFTVPFGPSLQRNQRLIWGINLQDHHYEIYLCVWGRKRGRAGYAWSMPPRTERKQGGWWPHAPSLAPLSLECRERQFCAQYSRAQLCQPLPLPTWASLQEVNNLWLRMCRDSCKLAEEAVPSHSNKHAGGGF